MILFFLTAFGFSVKYCLMFFMRTEIGFVVFLFSSCCLHEIIRVFQSENKKRKKKNVMLYDEKKYHGK